MVVTVGDQESDLFMFAIAGLGVAMAKANRWWEKWADVLNFAVFCIFL